MKKLSDILTEGAGDAVLRTRPGTTATEDLAGRLLTLFEFPKSQAWIQDGTGDTLRVPSDIAAGDTLTLTSDWSAFPGGAAFDVESVTDQGDHYEAKLIRRDGGQEGVDR